MPDDRSTTEERDDAATVLFDRWVAAHPDAGPAEFERFCEQQPEMTERLRRIWGYYDAARRLFDDVAPGPKARGLAQSVIRLARESTHWQPRGELGRGGLCVVEEIHESRLGRRLARKVLPIDVTRKDLTGTDLRRLARFVMEARIASRLRHPSIPPVFEFGLDDRNRPFLVLPLIEGVEFTEIIRRVGARDREWSIGRALQILVNVCGAVSHAHAVGIVHRDLKPENIMIGPFDETVLLDWGLAKPLGGVEEDTGDEIAELLDWQQTHDGDVVGTPVFLAPENARGDEGATEASDQYQLGALLYMLLAGTRPYESGALPESAREIVERVAAGPPTPLASVAPRAPAELVAICERAMAREPRERYASVEAFATDLRAFLEGRVVAAYETGAFATLRKWTSRNRAFAAAMGVSVLVVVAALATFLMLEREWRRDLERELYVNDLTLVQAGMLEGQRVSELRALLQRAPPALRGIEWDWLHSELDTVAERYSGCGRWALALAPSQAMFATGDDKIIKLWQLRPARLLASKNLESPGLPVAFSPDGTRLALIHRTRITIVRVPNLEVVQTFRADGDTRSICFSADGDRLFVSGRWNSLQVLDAHSGATLARLSLPEGTENVVACDAHQPRFAVGAWGGSVVVFDSDSYERLRSFQVGARVVSMSFADNEALHLATVRGTVIRYDLASGRVSRRVPSLDAYETAVQAVDPLGKYRVHARGAGLLLTELSPNRILATGNAHDAPISNICIVPGLRGVLSLSLDGEARFWHWQERQVRRRLTVGTALSFLAVTRDAKRAVLTGLGRGIGVLDLAGHGPIQWWKIPARRHNRLALSADDSAAAVCGPECPLLIVNLADGACTSVDLPEVPLDVGWNDVGIWAALPASKAVARVTTDGSHERSIHVGFEVERVLGRGPLLAAGGRAGDVVLLRDGRELWRVRCRRGITAFAFSPDATALACATADGPVEIRSCRDGSRLLQLSGHHGHVNGIQATQSRWLTTSVDRSVRIWAASDGRQLLKRNPDGGWLANLVVCAESDRILTGGDGAALHIWKIKP